MALDQLKSDRLTAAPVVAELEANDQSLRNVAWWIAGRHAEWGDQLAGLLRQELLNDADSDRRSRFIGHAAELSKSPAVRQMLADLVRDPATTDTRGGRRACGNGFVNTKRCTRRVDGGP